MSLPSSTQQGGVREPDVQNPAYALKKSNDAKRAVVSSASIEAASDESNTLNEPVSNSNDHEKSNLESLDDADADGPTQKVYHTGWRLHALTAG